MSKKYLICFTFAGGTKDFYNILDESLGNDVEMIKLEYSGHGSRMKEPLLETIQETVLDLYTFIKTKYMDILNGADVEYGLMGYSMGSITTIEMLKCILERGEMKPPKRVFVAAHEPMTKVQLLECPEADIDEYVKRRTIEFGGVPERLVNNKSFWRMYLPLYKADYLMIARYQFEKNDLKTDIPATVFFSEEDTAREDMQLWSDYFIRECELVEYTGKHFFINEFYKDISSYILAGMEK